MKWIILGALLGLLLVCPPLPAVAAATVAALVSKPTVLAFAAGALLWPRITRRIRGWTP